MTIRAKVAVKKKNARLAMLHPLIVDIIPPYAPIYSRSTKDSPILTQSAYGRSCDVLTASLSDHTPLCPYTTTTALTTTIVLIISGFLRFQSEVLLGFHALFMGAAIVAILMLALVPFFRCPICPILHRCTLPLGGHICPFCDSINNYHLPSIGLKLS